MLDLGLIGFAQPWLLLALMSLPVIWLLLRVTPPSPRRLTFPAIRLLFGLIPKEQTPSKTPLWLLLLRLLHAEGAHAQVEFAQQGPGDLHRAEAISGSLPRAVG